MTLFTCITYADSANLSTFQPIPLNLELNKNKVSLGERLFFDKKPFGKQSCGSCHFIEKGMADGLSFSTDLNGKKRTRNSQGLYNIAFQPVLNWDGKFRDLKAQALFLVRGALKSKWPDVIDYLRNNPQYNQDFNKIYNDGINKNNVADVIAVYQKSLITPNSRFDQYLRGQTNSLNAQEKNGFVLFKQYGCISCHNGIALGGTMIAGLGQFGDYFSDRGNIKTADFGYFNITGLEKDKFRFKVPSLRNVDKTAPYLHDASADTLPDAIKTMAKYQLGTTLKKQEIDDIEAFLKTLTGEYDGKPL